MNIKTLLIKIFTFLGGLYFFLEFVIPQNFLHINFEKYHESVTVGFITMGSMAVGLGIINLFSLHLDKIIYKKKDYFFSLTLLLSFLISVTIIFFDWYSDLKIVKKSNEFLNLSNFSEVIASDAKNQNKNVPSVNKRNDKLVEAINLNLQNIDLSKLKSGKEKEELEKYITKVNKITEKLKLDNENLKYNLVLSKSLRNLSISYKDYLNFENKGALIKKLYLFCFDGLFKPLVISMFSLLGFYVATASYKAFKVKSFESLLMMLSALIVILGQVPFGVKIWTGFPSLRMWLLSVPSTGAFRAISLGAFIAGLVMALRMWFSLEGSDKGGKD